MGPGKYSPMFRACCLGRFMVTNEKFGEFVGNTSYKTDSEKYGWSFVFLPMLSERQQREIKQVFTRWSVQRVCLFAVNIDHLRSRSVLLDWFLLYR